jgi:hypothetical protein
MRRRAARRPVSANPHEICIATDACGVPLHATLKEMLNEHFSHQSERRGCGYTQATRLLADHLNRAPGALDLKLLDAPPSDWSLRLDAAQAALELPESRLLMALLRSVLYRDAPSALPALEPVAPEKLKVGTCPLAEQYFLEIAHRFVRRRGRVNLIAATNGAPLLIEKRGLGDEHSCISIAPTRLNGVTLPIGSLVAVDYPEDALDGLTPTRSGRGQIVPIDRIAQFRFLRFTTLAVDPVDRPRAFSTHFQQQVAGGLFSPDTTRIDDLIALGHDERA